ncbi:MAG: FAD-binding protein, partial [Gemmataceae bacterium]|nr:FAD-binding protein [Gemmataceae bacterium]MDW8267158.1 FAD-binding protein [Gemmataceae bacterium]
RGVRRGVVVGGYFLGPIDRERRVRGPRRRVVTLLGPNRPWRDVLREHCPTGFGPALVVGLCWLLAAVGVGLFLSLVAQLVLRLRSSLGHWHFETLRPRSFAELLALCNRYNHAYVKVVGYNNGVVHFGQKFPGRTVVSTVGCRRVVRVGPRRVKADAGATLGQIQRLLADAGLELLVLPNYSYVCVGTAFFIPIHGSASACSTVADSIDKVVLYDPVAERFIVARRGGPAFAEHLYNLRSPAVVLRVYLRVKDKSRYFVQKHTWIDPSAEQLLAALRDDQAANVELRKSRASAREVHVCRYYVERATGPALELPRDTLGRLWDRLEANPLTSFVFHALTRHLAWHVELFFTADEFSRFWATHRPLPLAKIQLRYIRRDGFPYSPFAQHDCVSADMFMLRRQRRKFERYLRATFGVVRANPGKHSG